MVPFGLKYVLKKISFHCCFGLCLFSNVNLRKIAAYYDTMGKVFVHTLECGRDTERDEEN